MRNLFILLAFSIAFISCNSVEEKKTVETTPEKIAITTYYLIRHAEKDRSDPANRNPQLTEAGLQRAENWAALFKEIAFDRIYSTNYNRTMQTAMATANDQGITIENYDPVDMYSEDFKAQTVGKTVLIVGHSNTTPRFVNAITGKDTYPDMADNDNGSLYVVTVAGDEKKVQVLTVN